MPILYLLLALLGRQNPIFTTDMWPGEGIPVVVAASNSIPVYRMATSGSPLQNVPAQLGDTLRFDQTRFTTLEPGRLIASRRGELAGHDLGTLTFLSEVDYYSGRFRLGRWSYEPGAVVEYLQYRAEGICFVRFGGRVIDADPCPTTDTTVTQASAPVLQSWIRLTDSGGQALGWTIVDDQRVKVAGRKF